MNTLLAAIIVSITFFVLYGFCILCYWLFFTKDQDEYPVKYYGKRKSKSESQGRTNTDVSCNQLTSLEDWEG